MLLDKKIIQHLFLFRGVNRCTRCCPDVDVKSGTKGVYIYFTVGDGVSPKRRARCLGS